MANAPRVAILGPLGPAQLACLRSWRQAGVVTQFLHTEDAPLPAFAQKIADHYSHLGPIGEFGPDFLAVLNKSLQHAKAEAITCLGEQLAVRLWERRSQLPAGVDVLINSAETMQRLESKSLQIEAGLAAGFAVLPSALPRTPADVAQCAPLGYPLVLRPDRASQDPAFKVEFIDTPAQLNAFLSARAPDAPAVVAQRFVLGPNIVVHGSRKKDGSLGPFCSYLADLKHEGVMVTLQPFNLPAPVRQACERFACNENLRGVFHFDLLLDPDTQEIWFLEVNARLGGTTGKVLAAGYDEPLALLQSFGVQPDHPLHARRPDAPPKPAANRMAALKCILHGMQGKGSRIDYPFPSRRKILARGLTALLRYRDEVFSLRDLRGSLAFLSQYFV